LRKKKTNLFYPLWDCHSICTLSCWFKIYGSGGVTIRRKVVVPQKIKIPVSCTSRRNFQVGHGIPVTPSVNKLINISWTDKKTEIRGLNPGQPTSETQQWSFCDRVDCPVPSPWGPPSQRQLKRNLVQPALVTRDYDELELRNYLRQLQTHKSSWPFLKSVAVTEVYNFHQIVKNPTDKWFRPRLQRVVTDDLMSLLVTSSRFRVFIKE
jgi:hypothetical protein